MAVVVKNHPLEPIYLAESSASILAGRSVTYQLTVSDVANTNVAVGSKHAPV